MFLWCMLLTVGYRRVAVDVEVNFSSKKVTIPPVEDIVEAVGQATVPEGVRDFGRQVIFLNICALYDI